MMPGAIGFPTHTASCLLACTLLVGIMHGIGAPVVGYGGPVPQSASGCEAVQGQCLTESVHLLQRGGSARSQRRRPPSPELRRAMPIAWVHIPKSGTSFINTLIHLPGVCPGLPDDLSVDEDTFGDYMLVKFNQAINNLSHACPGLVDTGSVEHDSFLGAHTGTESLLSHFPKAFGRMMIMLRHPKERLLSAYDDLVFWRPHRDTIVDPTTSFGGWPNETLPSLQDYARLSRGCATKMLTHRGYPCGWSHGLPTEEEVGEAKRRLREGFSFVGITDDWDLSMCLFSTMFKVPCQRLMFMNARPGKLNNTEELEGLVDPYDAELYSEALEIFRENRRRYNVSHSSCAGCFRQAGL